MLNESKARDRAICGTVSAYGAGCRCSNCREASSIAKSHRRSGESRYPRTPETFTIPPGWAIRSVVGPEVLF